MAKRRGREQVEFLFGLKEAFLLLLLSGLVLGGVFFAGFEFGHKRALNGEESLLSFLGARARQRPEPVVIPDVLLNRDEDEEEVGEPPAPEPKPSPASPPTAAAVPSPPPQVEARVKPRAGVAVTAGNPPASPLQPRSSEPTPPAAAPVIPVGAFYYQVAAVGTLGRAENLAGWLRDEGHPAGVRPVGSDGLYRVYVGPFPTRASADVARDRLREDGFQPILRQY